jgi:muramoyltetrapeptide carboxypeptidase
MKKDNNASHASLTNQRIYVISPSGPVVPAEKLDTAIVNLKALGFKTTLDRGAKTVNGRFAGTDLQRLQALTRSLKQSADIVMAARGGYGMTRLLPSIDWRAVADSGKLFIGHSDFTAFNLALLATTGAVSYSGPVASADFGVPNINDLTADLFAETMRGELEILSFESENADAFDGRGILWGGNLAMLVSLLGTPFFPKIRGGILFVEDVNEHPYRVERLLLQLAQSGVLGRQKALVLGHFTGYRLAAHDQGFDMPDVIAHIRKTVGIPVIPGLPYGHTAVKATLPIGAKVGLATEQGMAHLVIHEH